MTDEHFLSRWARRKVAARKGEPLEEPVAPVVAPKAPAPPAPAPALQSAPPAAPAEAPELPSLDSLQGLVSEYRDFMQPQVDPNLQRAALKKLFSDPHFNVMDGLDVYIDDYGIPDPIPPAMLASLQHAKSLLFEEKEEDEASQDAAPLADDSPAPPPSLSQEETVEISSTEPVDPVETPATPEGGAPEEGRQN